MDATKIDKLPDFVSYDKRGEPKLIGSLLAKHVRENLFYKIVRDSGRSDQQIYVYADGVKDLLSELCKGKKSDDLVFTRENGDFISRQMVYSSFSRMIEKYGFIKPQINMKVNLHSLRHTFATRCIESGMQAKVLQHILGHKDITTTYNIYGDVFDRFEFDNILGADEYLKQQGLSINMS